MHRQLLALLKNGYLIKESDITDWREQFKEYCDNPDIVDGDIRGHFDHLEKIGEIDIGNYNVLRRIFKTFNAKAVKLIDKFFDKIQTAPVWLLFRMIYQSLLFFNVLQLWWRHCEVIQIDSCN